MAIHEKNSREKIPVSTTHVGGSRRNRADRRSQMAEGKVYRADAQYSTDHVHESFPYRLIYMCDGWGYKGRDLDRVGAMLYHPDRASEAEKQRHLAPVVPTGAE